MSLIELMVGTAMATIVSLGVYSTMNNMDKERQRIELLAVLAEKKNAISRMLSDEQTFKNTVKATDNTNLDCVRNRTTCSSAFVANTYSATQDRIVLYDNSPAPGRVYIDGRPTSTMGFTARGVACTGFSYDPAHGNDNCPIGYVVTWYAGNTGSTLGITITITAKLVYNPSDKGRLKTFINANATTALNSYDAVMTRNMASLVDLNTVSCEQDGIKLYNRGTYTFYYDTVAGASDHRCSSEIRQCVVTNNVPILSGTFQHASCVQDCVGAWDACSVACGGGTQTYHRSVEANQWGADCAFADGATQACNTAACPPPPTPPTPPSPPTPPTPGPVPPSPPGPVPPTPPSPGPVPPTPPSPPTPPTPGPVPPTPPTPGPVPPTPPSPPTPPTPGPVPPTPPPPPPPPPPPSAPKVNCAGSWGNCSKTCGGGTQTYSITTPASGGGTACSYANGATRACNTQACPVACVGSWSACSKSCGGGTQTYSITTPASGGGTACSYANGATQACNTAACPGSCDVNHPMIWYGATTRSGTLACVEFFNPASNPHPTTTHLENGQTERLNARYCPYGQCNGTYIHKCVNGVMVKQSSTCDSGLPR